MAERLEYSIDCTRNDLLAILESRDMELATACDRIKELAAAVRDMAGGSDLACEAVDHVPDDHHCRGCPCPVLARYRALVKGAT